MATARNTFQKHERLVGRDAFNTVMKEGRSLSDRPLRVVGRLVPLGDAAPARVAFAIPKRHVRNAVERNRIRRRMREAYRLEKQRWYTLLKDADLQCTWLFIWQSSRAPAYAEARERLIRLADRWLAQHLLKDRP